VKAFENAIDCDVHPAPPTIEELLPHLDDYWREQFVERHIDRLKFSLMSYPPTSPLSARPDWRTNAGAPAGSLDDLRRHVLDHFGSQIAICNVLHGAVALFNPDMAAALCSAVNDWTAANLLDNEPRLRASILVPAQDPELSAREIERIAHDQRFVQVLLMAMGDRLLGQRALWPIYAAAEKHGLPVGLHAGSTYRVAPTAAGWPSYRVEDYVAYASGFQNQIVSMVAEGVFSKFPRLKVVLIESGFTWLPAVFWRMGKDWRGARPETPWVDRAPPEILREHVRLTLQPIDAPGSEPDVLKRVIEHIGSDRLLLFSTDYPHWHFDGDRAVPEGLPEDMLRRILRENALETYPRLRANPAAETAARKETAS
jgi:predicted TIM-barrel fold metal-dependent hydrolase